MKVKTNAPGIAALCATMGVECEFFDEATAEEPYMFFVGEEVLKITEFCASAKGRMMLSLLGK